MAMSLGQVDPDSMINWTVSGELVFVTILSGPGNVIAPFIGSLVFEVLRTYAFELAPQAWQLIMGATFLTIIFLFCREAYGVSLEKFGGEIDEKSSTSPPSKGPLKTFGAVVAAKDINVDISNEEVVGIIGANGAGENLFC